MRTFEDFDARVCRMGRDAAPNVLEDFMEENPDWKELPDIQKILALAWTDPDSPAEYFENGLVWLDFFDAAGMISSLKKGEVFYRGGQLRSKYLEIGMSWTTDIAIARRFARHLKRIGGPGEIWKVEVPDDRMKGIRMHEFNDEREESEVILDDCLFWLSLKDHAELIEEVSA